jgi:hypothetical protein
LPEDIHELVLLLLRLVSDEDSFVYLGAIKAISTVADISRKLVLTYLLSAFVEGTPSADYLIRDIGAAPPALSAQIKEEEPLSLKSRSLVGEAISFILRRAGEAAPPLVPPVVNGCLKLIRQRQSQAEIGFVNELVDMRKMTLRADLLQETGTFEGESDLGQVPDSRTDLGATVDEETPIEGHAVLEAAASLCDAALLRQSAMSLLAEAVVAAGLTADRYLTDVLDAAVGVLTFERLRSEVASAMRRSACFLLKYLLSGLREKLFVLTDSGTYLKSVYRALKASRGDPDSVVRFHSESALSILDELMREQLFFSEATLRGENMSKIRIVR